MSVAIKKTFINQSTSINAFDAEVNFTFLNTLKKFSESLPSKYKTYLKLIIVKAEKECINAKKQYIDVKKENGNLKVQFAQSHVVEKASLDLNSSALIALENPIEIRQSVLLTLGDYALEPLLTENSHLSKDASIAPFRPLCKEDLLERLIPRGYANSLFSELFLSQRKISDLTRDSKPLQASDQYFLSSVNKAFFLTQVKSTFDLGALNAAANVSAQKIQQMRANYIATFQTGDLLDNNQGLQKLYFAMPNSSIKNEEINHHAEQKRTLTNMISYFRDGKRAPVIMQDEPKLGSGVSFAPESGKVPLKHSYEAELMRSNLSTTDSEPSISRLFTELQQDGRQALNQHGPDNMFSGSNRPGSSPTLENSSTNSMRRNEENHQPVEMGQLSADVQDVLKKQDSSSQTVEMGQLSADSQDVLKKQGSSSQTVEVGQLSADSQDVLKKQGSSSQTDGTCHFKTVKDQESVAQLSAISPDLKGERDAALEQVTRLEAQLGQVRHLAAELRQIGPLREQVARLEAELRQASAASEQVRSLQSLLMRVTENAEEIKSRVGEGPVFSEEAKHSEPTQRDDTTTVPQSYASEDEAQNGTDILFLGSSVAHDNQ
jgi:hypothetical protein